MNDLNAQVRKNDGGQRYTSQLVSIDTPGFSTQPDCPDEDELPDDDGLPGEYMMQGDFMPLECDGEAEFQKHVDEVLDN